MVQTHLTTCLSMLVLLTACSTKSTAPVEDTAADVSVTDDNGVAPDDVLGDRVGQPDLPAALDAEGYPGLNPAPLAADTPDTTQAPHGSAASPHPHAPAGG